MNCNFTYDHFKECINLGKKLGYSFHTMHDFLSEKPENNFIVMRHDVDLSLKHALVMAKVEKELGIKSTYFVRTQGVFDPFSSENLKYLGKILELGHEIGIHYEFDDKPLNEFKASVLDEKQRFEFSLNTKIFGAALHKTKTIGMKDPDKLNIVEDFLPDLELEYDAYSDKFLKQMKFISDSKFRWREVCMCNHIKKKSKLCILTHPIWWSDKTTSLVSIMEELLMDNSIKR